MLSTCQSAAYVTQCKPAAARKSAEVLVMTSVTRLACLNLLPHYLASPCIYMNVIRQRCTTVQVVQYARWDELIMAMQTCMDACVQAAAVLQLVFE